MNGTYRRDPGPCQSANHSGIIRLTVFWFNDERAHPHFRDRISLASDSIAVITIFLGLEMSCIRPIEHHDFRKPLYGSDGVPARHHDSHREPMLGGKRLAIH